MVTTIGGDISTFYGERDVWLFRIDADGNMLWEKSYGNHSMNRINKMIATSYGTFMFTGSFYEKGGMIYCQKDESENEPDVWVVEIDINGEIVFQNCYGGSHDDTGTGLFETDDGFVILALSNSNDMDVSGFHGVAGETFFDIWAFKIDLFGSIIWQNCLGGTNFDAAASVFNSGDSSYMVIGYVNSNDGDVVGNHSTIGKSDIWIVNLDSMGEIVWQQCIGSVGRESLELHCAAQINEYNYVIACETGTLHGDVECEINPDPYDSSTDAWVINIKDCSQFQPETPQQPTGIDTLCVNTDSITTYSARHAANAWYYQWELQPETAGTVSISDSIITEIHWNPVYEGVATLKVSSYNDCGESQWSDSLDIYTYICLGTGENENKLPVFVVYPNPVRGVLNIKSNSKAGKELNIEVFDIFGRLVYDPEPLEPLVSINTSNWQKGLYFVRVMEDGNSLGVRKVVVE